MNFYKWHGSGGRVDEFHNLMIYAEGSGLESRCYPPLFRIVWLNLTQNKMNLFVLSGHGSESFAAFLNGVILQKKQRGSYHCSCHHNTSRE